MNGGSRPESDIPRVPVKVSDAAIFAVHAQQSVLTHSAKTHHSPDTDNPADAGFLRA
jgi:hypothetical protein